MHCFGSDLHGALLKARGIIVGRIEKNGRKFEVSEIIFAVLMIVSQHLDPIFNEARLFEDPIVSNIQNNDSKFHH